MFKKSPPFSDYNDLSKWMNENGIPNCRQPSSSYPVVAVIADVWVKSSFVKKYEYVTWGELNQASSAKADKPKVEVYHRPECIFNYCPSENVCKENDICIHPDKNLDK